MASALPHLAIRQRLHGNLTRSHKNYARSVRRLRQRGPIAGPSAQRVCRPLIRAEPATVRAATTACPIAHTRRRDHGRTVGGPSKQPQAQAWTLQASSTSAAAAGRVAAFTRSKRRARGCPSVECVRPCLCSHRAQAADPELPRLVRSGSEAGVDEGGCSATRAVARCACRSGPLGSGRQRAHRRLPQPRQSRAVGRSGQSVRRSTMPRNLRLANTGCATAEVRGPCFRFRAGLCDVVGGAADAAREGSIER